MLKHCILFICIAAGLQIAAQTKYLSPQQLIIHPEKQEIYILPKTARRIDIFDPASNKIKASVQLKNQPNGMSLNPHNQQLIVSSGAGTGQITVIDLNSYRIEKQIKAGHSLYSPVIVSEDIIAVCDRFSGKVNFIDVHKEKVIKSADVAREPIAAELDNQHNQLVVAHHLPDDAATDSIVSAELTFITIPDFTVSKQISLPNGSGSVKEIEISPCNRYAVVSHILARFIVHTTQLEQGWQNTNAISLIDLEKQEVYHTVLLDDVQHGAANPWALAFSEDGEKLLVTHAGTSELSIIDFPALLKKLQEYPTHPGHFYDYRDPANKLSFLHGIRKRVLLKGFGPRGICITGNTIWIAHYYSDALEKLDEETFHSNLIPLTEERSMTAERMGEYLFHSASLCFENWQSCSSCHPDGRVDAYNWDLLNDGIGNPKNALSLLNSHRTPPAMSTGVRPSAEKAVRAGMQFIQFMEHDEANARAIDSYLKSLRPVSSPVLINGKLSAAAKRGKKIYKSFGCSDCHPAPLFTNLKKYNVGTHSTFDFTSDEEGQPVPQTEFDTPTLIETWRTAPYLHDGRYRTLEELFLNGKHGLQDIEKPLNEKKINNLVEYVKSL